MANPWQSAYVHSGDAAQVTALLRDEVARLGYEFYDPFTGLPGQSYPRTVRLFVAPPADGWTRVIGELDSAMLPALSRLGLCLYLDADEDACEVSVFQNEQPVAPGEALRPFLDAEHDAEALEKALAGKFTVVIDTARGDDSIPLEVLPEDMQDMARNLTGNQMGKMFNKIMGGVRRRISGGEEDDARALLEGSRSIWQTTGGQHAQAVMNCLTIPAPYWQRPDLLAVRDAYLVSARRQRNPNARLYPGDAEALDTVPDALDYTPIYGGTQG